jgi:squalene cyclase
MIIYRSSYNIRANQVPIRSNDIARAVSYLEKHRDKKKGVWHSYWWKGYAYGTYNALKALSMCRCLRYAEWLKSAQFFLSTQRTDGGWSDGDEEKSEVFGTAFTVLSLLLYPNINTLYHSQRGIQWLNDQQNDD